MQYEISSIFPRGDSSPLGLLGMINAILSCDPSEEICITIQGDDKPRLFFETSGKFDCRSLALDCGIDLTRVSFPTINGRLHKLARTVVKVFDPADNSNNKVVFSSIPLNLLDSPLSLFLKTKSSFSISLRRIPDRMKQHVYPNSKYNSQVRDYYAQHIPSYEIGMSATKEIAEYLGRASIFHTSDSDMAPYYSYEETDSLLSSFEKLGYNLLGKSISSLQMKPYSLLDDAYICGSGAKLGYYRTEQESICFPADALPTSVVGASGSGKTTLLSNMSLQRLHVGESVIILSPKADFRHLYRTYQGKKQLFSAVNPTHPLFLNFIKPPCESIPEEVWAQQVTKLFKYTMPIDGEGSVLPSLFSNALNRLYLTVPPANWNLFSFRRAVHDELYYGTYAKEIRRNLAQASDTRMKDLMNSPVFNCNCSNIDYEKMLESGALTVFEFNDIPTENLVLVAGIIIYTINLLVSRKPVVDYRSVSLIIDEAHRLLDVSNPKQLEFRRDLIASNFETRSKGLAITYADQRFTSLGEDILFGSAYRLILRTPPHELCDKTFREEVDTSKFKFGEALFQIEGCSSVPIILPPPLVNTSPDEVNKPLKQNSSAYPFTFCRNFCGRSGRPYDPTLCRVHKREALKRILEGDAGLESKKRTCTDMLIIYNTISKKGESK